VFWSCWLADLQKVLHLFEFFVEALFTPGPVWVGTILGVLAAGAAWYFLPESVDRVAIGAWAVGVGFVGGWLVAIASARAEK